jgi:hypothetical protein
LAKEGCEAGAGDDGKHGSVGVVQARLARLNRSLPWRGPVWPAPGLIQRSMT